MNKSKINYKEYKIDLNSIQNQVTNWTSPEFIINNNH